MSPIDVFKGKWSAQEQGRSSSRSVDGIFIIDINMFCSVRRTNVRHKDGRTRHHDNEETHSGIYIFIIYKKYIVEMNIKRLNLSDGQTEVQTYGRTEWNLCQSRANLTWHFPDIDRKTLLDIVVLTFCVFWQ